MTKSELIKKMVKSGVLKSPEIINAFEKIDRAHFVRERNLKDAYQDYPLPIGFNATISQPSTVSFMLELLEPQAGDTVLDVGSGSAWTTALLAHVVGEEGRVYGVEIEPNLVDFGRNNLEKLGFENAYIEQAGSELGLLKHAPYDKILVSAAARNIPEKLVQQLKDEGTMVIPIQSSIWKIEKLSEIKIKKEEFFGFSFVPLR